MITQMRKYIQENIIEKITSLFSSKNVFQPQINTSEEEVRLAFAQNDNKDSQKLPTVHSLMSTGGQNTYDWYAKELKLEVFRKKVYEEYDLMDSEDPILGSALDVYADNATQGDSESDVVATIITKDGKIKDLFNQMKKQLNLDLELWSIARTIAKYGEDFEEIVFDDTPEVIRLKNLDGKYIWRLEDKYGRLMTPAYLQKVETTDKIEATFNNWQVVHFRLRRNRNSKYGSSVFYPIRKTFKQLSMMEDALVLTRLTRAVLRYVFYIDTEGMSPDDAEQHIDKTKQKLKRRPTIDPNTGQMNMNYNPLAQEEDIFVGTKEKSRADVKVLQGYSPQSLLDLEYLQNKKFAGIKVPKAYLALERDVNAKATVTEQDVQFARSVRRIQYAIQEGVKQIFNTVLILNDIDYENTEYKISLPIISAIDELRKWNMEQVKAQVVQTLKASLQLPDEWLLQKFFSLSDEEIAKIKVDNEENIRNDTALGYELQQQYPPIEPTPAITESMINSFKRKNKKLLQETQMLLDWKLGKEIQEETLCV